MRCSKCSRDAIIYRKYSGERLCVKHFLSSIENKVYSRIRDVIKGKRRIGLAVSGGKDSLSMTYIINRIVKKKKWRVEIVGLLINEGISGYRDECISKALKFFEDLGLELKIVGFDQLYSLTVDEIARRINNINMICSYCGVLRRRALEMIGRRERVDLIFTGHNASDTAQTIVMNVIQGNIKHLSETVRFPGVILKEKPLSMILEKEVTLYATLRNIDFCSTPCPYTRHSLRNEVRNFLSKLEENHPGVTYSIIRLGEKLREKIKTDIVVKECKMCGFPTTKEVCKACELLSGFKKKL